MPQGRIVLKSICQSRKISELETDGARLLYTWLIPNLDINGCFSGDAVIVKSLIFTRLNKTNDDVEFYLNDLAKVGLICLYESEEDIYLQVPDFADKQPSLNPSKEAKPTIPLPTPDQLQSNSRLTPPKVKESKEEVKESEFTLKQVENSAFIIGMSDAEALDFHTHYNAQGWLLGNGLPITDLKSALTKWRNNGHKFEKPVLEPTKENAMITQWESRLGGFIRQCTVEAIMNNSTIVTSVRNPAFKAWAISIKPQLQEVL